jgi:antitoxin component YwqK of YwqJK toxin-antitoxin module
MRILFSLLILSLSLQLVSQKTVDQKSANGKDLLQGQTVEGERHGLWKEYNKQGMLIKETIYDHGKKQSEKIYNTRNGKLRLELEFTSHPWYGYFKEYTPDGICWREQYGEKRGDRVNTGISSRNQWGPKITRSTKSGTVNYFTYFNAIPQKPELKIEFPMFNFFENGAIAGVTLHPQRIAWHQEGFLREIKGHLDINTEVYYRWNDKRERVNNSYRAIENDTLVFDQRLAQNQIRYQMLEGLPEGRWTNFYPNGQLWFVQNYTKGKLNGTYEAYYINGQKRYQMEFSHGLSHGAFQEWYPNGQLKTEGVFDRGMLTGNWRSWTENGTLITEESWAENQKHGIFKKWTEEGIMILSENYKDGKLHGPKTLWHPNGKLKIKMNTFEQYGIGMYEEYADNGQLIKQYFHQHGLIITYHKNGNMAGISCRAHDNASTLRLRWNVDGSVFDANYHWSNNDYLYIVYENNEIKESKYRKGDETYTQMIPLKFLKEPEKLKFEWQGKTVNGFPEGVWEMRYPNGEIWVRQSYINGYLQGPMEIYNLDGTLIERTKISRDQLHGLHQVWLDDGTLIKSENYLSNQKSGTAKTWYPDGTLKSETTYLNGVYHGPHKGYDAQGKINASGNYTNGKRDGLNNYYKYPEGFLWSTSNYKDGIRHGEFTLFFPDGKVQSKGNFYKGKKHGVWYVYEKDGSLKETAYFSFGEKELKPIKLACQCTENYSVRGKTVFFPPVKSYAEFEAFKKESQKHILLDEKSYLRTYCRGVMPSFDRSYGSLSMTLINFDTLAFSIVGAEAMKLVINPCLTINQFSDHHFNLRYSHYIRRYIPDFDYAQFEGTNRAYFDIMYENSSGGATGLVLNHIRIMGYEAYDNKDEYKKFLKELYKLKVIEKSHYKKGISTEELEELLDEVYNETEEAIKDLIFEEAFDKVAEYRQTGNPTPLESRLGQYYPSFRAFGGMAKFDQALEAIFDVSIYTDNIAVDISKKLLQQYDTTSQQIILHNNKSYGARLLFGTKYISYNSKKGIQLTEQQLNCASSTLITNTNAIVNWTSAYIFTSQAQIQQRLLYSRSSYSYVQCPSDFAAGIYARSARGSMKIILNGNEHLLNLRYHDVFLDGEKMIGCFSFDLDNSSIDEIQAALPKVFNAKVFHEPVPDANYQSLPTKGNAQVEAEYRNHYYVYFSIAP